MNVNNLIIIAAVLFIWSQIVQFTVPTTTGRTIIGILGSVIIGGSFAMAGITIVGVQ